MRVNNDTHKNKKPKGQCEGIEDTDRKEAK